MRYNKTRLGYESWSEFFLYRQDRLEAVQGAGGQQAGWKVHDGNNEPVGFFKKLKQAKEWVDAQDKL